MSENVPRKQKTNVLFEFMEVMLNTRNRTRTVDAWLAKDKGWSKAHLAALLNELPAKGILICTETGCRHRMASLPMSINSHADWLVLYYRGDVPPRYRHHLQ